MHHVSPWRTNTASPGENLAIAFGNPGSLSSAFSPSARGLFDGTPKNCVRVCIPFSCGFTVGGRPYTCTRVTTTLTYPDGRKSTMLNWFSKDVPFASNARHGGLVKRQFGRLTMELPVFDLKGARIELQLPAAAPK